MKNALLIMMPPPDLWGVRDMAVFRTQSNSPLPAQQTIGTAWVPIVSKMCNLEMRGLEI